MDLYFATLSMGLLAVAISVTVSRCLRPVATPVQSSRLPGIVLSLAVIAGVVLLFGTKDRLVWTRVIQDSAAIVWSNITVLALAVGVGAAVRLPNRPKWRRYWNAGALMLLAALTLAQPLLQPILRPIQGSNQWDKQGVCMQTRSTTCSAAAGATLLRAHGIEISEAKMVEICLTDARGTPSLGLWRGLRMATAGTAVRPRSVSATVDDLLTRGPWPAVLVVGLPSFGANPVYTQRYGWDPGFRHSVVLFGRKADGLLDIGDPAIGRETWSEEDLRVLWRGEAIELIPIKHEPVTK
jgi:Peptidase C39 family